MFDVELARCFGVVLRVQVMAMGRVSMFGGRGDIFALVMLRCLLVMMRSLLVMHRRLFVMVSDLIRMGHDVLSGSEADGFVRAPGLLSACYRITDR
jgi:hypothetical protein